MVGCKARLYSACGESRIVPSAAGWDWVSRLRVQRPELGSRELRDIRTLLRWLSLCRVRLSCLFSRIYKSSAAACEVGSTGFCKVPLHASLLAVRRRIPREGRPSLDQGGRRDFAGASKPAARRWLRSGMRAGTFPRRTSFAFRVATIRERTRPLRAEWAVESLERGVQAAELPQPRSAEMSRASGQTRAGQIGRQPWPPAGIEA